MIKSAGWLVCGRVATSYPTPAFGEYPWVVIVSVVFQVGSSFYASTATVHPDLGFRRINGDGGNRAAGSRLGGLCI